MSKEQQEILDTIADALGCAPSMVGGVATFVAGNVRVEVKCAPVGADLQAVIYGDGGRQVIQGHAATAEQAKVVLLRLDGKGLVKPITEKLNKQAKKTAQAKKRGE